MTDPYVPDLRIGRAGQEAIGRSDDTLSEFVGAGLDVNGDDLTLVSFFHQRADVPVVDLRAALSDFLSAVSWLSG